jgi:hypothetical protein
MASLQGLMIYVSARPPVFNSLNLRSNPRSDAVVDPDGKPEFRGRPRDRFAASPNVFCPHYDQIARCR